MADLTGVAELAPAATAVEVEGPARRRQRPIFVILAAAVLAIVVVLAAIGPQLAPHDPSAQNVLLGTSGPSAAHPLGTDDLGRDILSRVFAGARSAVVGPLLIALGAAVLSATFGLAAGFRGRRTDSVIMRLTDVGLALPPFLVILVVAGIFNGGYLLAVALLIALFAPWDTRIVRGATLEQAPRPYVEATTVLGLSQRRTMWLHILPNILPLIVVTACLDFAGGLVALSGLSFLGIGVSPGAADWGRMLADNEPLIFSNPAAAIAPGVAIVLTAAAVSVVGDWAYERLSGRQGR